jgi:DNA-binding transcriptional LysR family regulator
VKLMKSALGLRALAALDEHGSFQAAAGSLGITQSAVSQHVAALERTAAMSLVLPRTRPVELTAAGRLLAAHGRAVVDRLSAAEHDLAELAEKDHARLRLGSFPTALATFVPPAIQRLRHRVPHLSLTVVDDHMQGLHARLDSRELDVAIVFGGDDDQVTLPEGFSLTPLLRDRYQLLLPRGHRLLGRHRPAAWRDLAEETWVGGGPSSVWFRPVRDACRDAGFEPRTGVISDDHLAVQAFVSAGLGIAMVPGLAAVRRISGVERIDVRGSMPSRQIGVAHVDDPFVPQAVTTIVDLLPVVARRWAAKVSP